MSSSKRREEGDKGKIVVAKDKEKKSEEKQKFDTIVKTYLDEITKTETTSESSIRPDP
jgi:hypothetical protein